MSGPIVVFRTVSVEKMSPVLNACRVQWPEAPLWVVSSSGRVEEMRRDARVARVLAMEMGTSGFGRKVDLDTKARAAVVPVANAGGSGYGNVFDAALGVDADDYLICSRCKSLVSLGRGRFGWRAFCERNVGKLARLFSGYWADRALEG